MNDITTLPVKEQFKSNVLNIIKIHPESVFTLYAMDLTFTNINSLKSIYGLDFKNFSDGMLEVMCEKIKEYGFMQYMIDSKYKGYLALVKFSKNQIEGSIKVIYGPKLDEVVNGIRNVRNALNEA